jgi:hypothetical protein
VKVSRQRHDRPSSCCWRTTASKDWRHIDCLPLIGWRFTDGDGHRSKEPINVSNVPFPIFSALFSLFFE